MLVHYSWLILIYFWHFSIAVGNMHILYKHVYKYICVFNHEKNIWRFYLKWVPRSRLGANALSLTMVEPVPVADRRTACVWPSWIDTSIFSWKWVVSLRWATTWSSSWLSGGTSPSLGRTLQKDFLWLWEKKKKGVSSMSKMLPGGGT